MAYDYQMGGGYYEGETEEERRRRLEAEAAAAGTGYGGTSAEDLALFQGQAPTGPAVPQTSSFGDVAGQYLGKRVDTAMSGVNNAVQVFTDPTAALQRRMGQPEQPDLGNTEVQSQQIKTYADGSQEEIVKRQMPAPTAAPVAPTAMAPAPQAEQPQPQNMPQAAPGATPAVPGLGNQATQDPEEIQRRIAALNEMKARNMATVQPAPAVEAVAPQAQAPQAQAPQAQAPQAAAAQPVQAAPMPGANLAQMAQAAPVTAPIDPNAPVPNIGTVPVPGPGIQVASTQPDAGVAEAAAAAQAAQQPAWVQAANSAGTDFAQLLDVAARFPEARGAIQAKIKETFANQLKADEAAKIVEAAQSGDAKALNKLEQALRPTRGREREEVTTGDYLKAYMYARLGLNDLSAQVQAKIAGTDTKFGQIQLGNSTWSVETDAKTGKIVRARDDEGTVATANTLNKLNAAGQKFGAQIYSSTGGSQVIPAGQPDAGEEYRSVFNSTTGNFENKIITGKNTGNTYSGPAGVDKSVSTQGAKALNQAFIDFQTKPTTAAATEALKTAALVGNDAYNQTLAAIRSRSPSIFNEITSGGAGTLPVPNNAGAQTNVGGARTNVGGGAARTNVGGGAARTNVGGGAATGGSGGGLLQQTEQLKANVGTAAAINTTRGQEAVKNVEKLATDTATNADAAGQTATVARRIRTAVTDNPEIPGMLTKTNNKGLDIITATVAAIDAGLGGSDAIQAAAKQMNFNARQVAVFDQIKGDLTELALARARENKGQGTFTDFERRLFAETTGDLARNPASAIQYRMEIFEYAADKTIRKSEFIEDYRSRNLNATSGQINNAWRKESKTADEEFEKRLRDTYINPKFKVLRP